MKIDDGWLLTNSGTIDTGVAGLAIADDITNTEAAAFLAFGTRAALATAGFGAVVASGAGLTTGSAIARGTTAHLGGWYFVNYGICIGYFTNKNKYNIKIDQILQNLQPVSKIYSLEHFSIIKTYCSGRVLKANLFFD